MTDNYLKRSSTCTFFGLLAGESLSDAQSSESFDLLASCTMNKDHSIFRHAETQPTICAHLLSLFPHAASAFARVSLPRHLYPESSAFLALPQQPEIINKQYIYIYIYIFNTDIHPDMHNTSNNIYIHVYIVLYELSISLEMESIRSERERDNKTRLLNFVSSMHLLFS